MANLGNPVDAFLNSYFKAHEMRMKEREFDQNQSRLNAELAYRQVHDRNQMDLQQRQHDAQMAFQQSQAQASQAQHKDTMDFQKAKADWEFGERGGKIVPSADLAPVKAQINPYVMGGGAAPAQGSAPAMPSLTEDIMSQPDPRVGPSKSSIPVSQNQLAAAQLPTSPLPQIPIPAQTQMVPNPAAPNAEQYTEVSPLPGAASDKHYFALSPAGKTAQNKAALDEADQMEIDPTQAKALGIDAGSYRKSMIPLFVSHMDKMAADATARARIAESEAEKQNALEETKRFHDMSIAMQSQTNADRAAARASKTGDIKDIHQSVMENPDSFHNLSKDQKTEEISQLRKEGLPAPTQLNPVQKDTEQFARRAINSIETVLDTLNNPRLRSIVEKRSGAVLGRVGDAEQDLGATQGLSDADARIIQKFRSDVRYLTFQEGKTLFGSRIPIQLMNELKSTSPKTTESIAMLQGSMDSVRNNAENALASAWSSRFGGKEPTKDWYERNNIKGKRIVEKEASGVPPAIFTTLEEGVPKVFTNQKTQTDRTLILRNGKVYEVTKQ